MKTRTIELAASVILDMVYIPSGTFMMGSPEDDPERFSNEIPQHQVTITEFWMGRYPITQTQWRAVASLPQIERKLDPDPSRFSGNNRPVENVSWYDAMEFCARLSAHRQRTYTLPSEAQWEYACRAGTTTPFYFGETLTSDLANYYDEYALADGPKGVYREGPTNVGRFPPNAFGLCGMHGSVWEWCLDHSHGDYYSAPADGRAWVTGGDSSFRMLRGGSWLSNSRLCRSACRDNHSPDRGYNNGFRVVCNYLN